MGKKVVVMGGGGLFFGGEAMVSVSRQNLSGSPQSYHLWLPSVTPSHAVRGSKQRVNGNVSGEWRVWLFQGLGFLAVCLFVCGWVLPVVVLSECLLEW